MKYLTRFVSPALDRNPFRIVFPIVQVALAFGLSIFIFNPGFAQTPEQLQQLNSLPADQRDALIEQLGIGDQQQLGQAQGLLDFPDVVEEPFEENEPLVPKLAPGDTLVIEFVERPVTEIVSLNASAPPVQSVPLDPQQAVAATAGAVEMIVIAPGVLGRLETEEIDSLELAKRQELLKQLEFSNPYELDIHGFLHLTGARPIRLAGLNVEEAMIRIRSEPSLVWLQPIVTFLPLDPFGVNSLESFGYDLFEGVPTTFAPATDVPVPAEYVMGPGDTVNVMFFGSRSEQYQLIVSREGSINFPEIGPIGVVGLSFEELKVVISQRVEEQMIGVRSSITLGQLRSIRVFVLGDVQQPGSYTVSGLSTMTNALFVSGGVNDVGSLRQIELRRGGEIVTTLDLYDLLLRGDTSGDERLQPGDVIFAPPIRNSISVYGAVRRPAIYEINGETSVEQVVFLAGGFTSNADLSRVKLERVMPSGTTVYNINLASQIKGIQSLKDGDILTVQTRVEQLDNAVRLSGNVFQPGIYSWYEGLTVTDLIGSRELIKPGSDLGYVLVRREIQPNVLTDVFSIDLQSAWVNPGGEHDILLQSRDTVYVFDRLNSRQRVVIGLLNELKDQAFGNNVVPVVSVGGQVNSPGEYPLEPGMTISDLVRAGGGITDAAYTVEAELVRYSVVDGGMRQTNIESVNVRSALEDIAGANISLTSYDHLNIKVVSNWNDEVRLIELIGEVSFPGFYPLIEGETLHSLMQRAGGLTDYAFSEGSLFIRESLIELEGQRLEELADRLESDLQGLAMDPGNAAATAAGAALVARLRNTVPVGRLVIDLAEVMNGNQNLLLRDGDQLYIPPVTQEVTVIGEVQYATSHVYEGLFDRDDYVAMSGGTTDNADEKRVYTVHANGGVDVQNTSSWFVGKRSSEVFPGDTIVVPSDTSVSQIPLLAAATQIVYNIAIAAAALNSF